MLINIMLLCFFRVFLKIPENALTTYFMLLFKDDRYNFLMVALSYGKSIFVASFLNLKKESKKSSKEATLIL